MVILRRRGLMVLAIFAMAGSMGNHLETDLWVPYSVTVMEKDSEISKETRKADRLEIDLLSRMEQWMID
jgi:hypothetical protein